MGDEGKGSRTGSLQRLPPALDRDLHTLDRELDQARELSPGERLEALRRVCQSAVRLAEMGGRRRELARRRDPLPESTRRALARLREDRRIQ